MVLVRRFKWTGPGQEVRPRNVTYVILVFYQQWRMDMTSGYTLWAAKAVGFKMVENVR